MSKSSQTSSTQIYLWPLVFAAAPATFSILFGNSKLWSELLLLLAMLFYLYIILKGRILSWSTFTNKVPWELYQASRVKRKHLRQESDSQKALGKMESRFLCMFLLSPLVGGLGLECSRRCFSSFLVISKFDIILFISAASIRPILHLIAITREEIQELQTDIVYPESDLEVLQERLLGLENELMTLKHQLAAKESVEDYKKEMNEFTETLYRKLETRMDKVSHQYKKSIRYLELKLQETLQLIRFSPMEDSMSVQSRRLSEDEDVLSLRSSRPKRSTLNSPRSPSSLKITTIVNPVQWALFPFHVVQSVWKTIIKR